MSRLVYIAFLLCCSIGAAAQTPLGFPHVPQPKTSYDTVTMTVIGDVMMHKRQLEYDQKPFLERIAPRLRESDFSVANMEFALGGQPYSGYPSFSAPDSYADYVASLGVDVFLCANNHILDKGTKGLSRTIDRYRSMSDSVRFTGIAGTPEELRHNYPLILSKNGIRIAIVNFTYGTNNESQDDWPRVNRMSRKDISDAIGTARRKHADFIIAMPHWGTEYSLKHSESQEEFARWLVGQGVDAIIGAHPHVVQDTSHICGVPVVYSIGNAVSNMSAANTRLELAVRMKFVRTGMETKMLEPELMFMWCTLPGNLTDNYATIFVDEYLDKKQEWIVPADYDNMTETLSRVISATGIKK